MRNYDSEKHVKGESQFVDDLLTPTGLLHIIMFSSSVAHGKIIKTDYPWNGDVRFVPGKGYEIIEII